ncbi:MAG: hypothetical protein R2761_29250 [Acidimicrobiales bacterium]
MSSVLVPLIGLVVDVVSVELRALRVLGIAVALVLMADVAARKAARR